MFHVDNTYVPDWDQQYWYPWPWPHYPTDTKITIRTNTDDKCPSCGKCKTCGK